jgi:hypothetical protein
MRPYSLDNQPSDRMGAWRAGPLQENIEMKTLTTIALAALFCFAGSARAESTRSSTRNLRSSAREKLFLGLDGDFAVPVGNYSKANGVGAGVMATAEYPVMPELSATARIGFQYHANKNVLGMDTHAHSVPVLVGAKYYLMPGVDVRQGLFAAAELGLFDLISGASTPTASASSNDLRFGAGVGIGWAMKQWNARVNLHSHDVGHFGDALMMTAGIGYQFAGI